MSEKKSDENRISAIPPFGLRMLPALRDSIREAADANGRSMNAEIVARLESWQDLSDQVADSGNAQLLHMWKSWAKSQKIYSDTMVLNLNNLSRFVLDQAEHVPQQLVDAAKRHFEFSEAYLEELALNPRSSTDDGPGSSLFAEERDKPLSPRPPVRIPDAANTEGSLSEAGKSPEGAQRKR